MGRRGPIPKSNELKMLEGNPSKRPLKGDQPQPSAAADSCPSWLAPAARDEWQRLAPELIKLGILTEADQAMFAAYCTACAVWRRAQEVISKQGPVYVTGKGKLLPRPEVALAHSAAEQMRVLGAEFGLTPASRARLQLPPPRSPEDDVIEQIINDNWRRNGR